MIPQFYFALFIVLLIIYLRYAEALKTQDSAYVNIGNAIANMRGINVKGR